MTIQKPRREVLSIARVLEPEAFGLEADPAHGEGKCEDCDAKRSRATALAAKIYGVVVNPATGNTAERTILGGHLSRAAQFRLIVTGEVGQAEVDHLISQLNLLRAVLGEPE